jgi:hypothetical protein
MCEMLPNRVHSLDVLKMRSGGKPLEYRVTSFDREGVTAVIIKNGGRAVELVTLISFRDWRYQ